MNCPEETIIESSNTFVELLRPEHKAFLKLRKKEADWKDLKRGIQDLSTPLPLRIRAGIPGNASSGTLELSKTRDFSEFISRPMKEGLSAPIQNLNPGRTYYWRVRSANGISGISTFSTSPQPPRWIAAAGLSNIRDLGGWKTLRGGRIRQDMIFRGSELDDHMNTGPEGIRVLKDFLHIKTELDLRKNPEGYRSPLEKAGIRRFAFPLLSYEEILTKDQMRCCGRLFSFLADPRIYPVYLHCWGGADRTGTVVYLLETLLGVSKTDRIRDYEITSFAIFEERSRMKWEAFQEKWNSFHAKTESGKAVCFLRECGVSNREIQQIRKMLVEPAEGVLR